MKPKTVIFGAGDMAVEPLVYQLEVFEEQETHDYTSSGVEWVAEGLVVRGSFLVVAEEMDIGGAGPDFEVSGALVGKDIALVLRRECAGMGTALSTI